MKEKRNVTFDEENHKYMVDGVEIPSVTTIISMVDSHYQSISPVILEQAKARGTAVHEATQLIDYGCEPEIFPEIAGYVKAYEEFLSVYLPKWDGIEEITYSDKLGYIGTVDRYGKILGKDVVFDLKTTTSPTKDNYISVCLQTSAYAFALGIPGAKRYALYLRKDGTYRVFDCEKWEEKHNFDSWNLFLDILELYKKMKKI